MGDVRRSQPLSELDELLPTEIEGAMRADALLRELPPHKEAADIPSSMIAALEMPAARPQGITVETRPSERTLLIRYEEKVVAVVRWLQQSGEYHVKYRHTFVPGANIGTENMIEYKCAFPQVWKICCLYGVTIDELQGALVNLPPSVEWRFDQCPWPSHQKQMACKLDMKGDPRSDIAPGLRCRVCTAEFAMDEKGRNLTLTYPGADPAGGPPLARSSPLESAPGPVSPAKPEIPFARDFVRYQYAGKAKLDQLEAAGIGSWAQLSALEVEELVREYGWNRKHAEVLLEIAKEKA